MTDDEFNKDNLKATEEYTHLACLVVGIQQVENTLFNDNILLVSLKIDCQSTKLDSGGP
jgi:hypothetical protein